MGRHREDGSGHMEGDLFEPGPKKEPLTSPRDPLHDGMAETSTSPIETF